MSVESGIEWCDSTWNPLLGCDKCSDGCRFCYAIRTAWRLQHHPNPKIAAAYEGLVAQRADGSLNWTGRINLLPERLREPMGWRKPRRIFVNSQSDLFHPRVKEEFIDQVFATMALCPQHTFQILTKRPERMAAYLNDCRSPEVNARPLPNVWLGTSVENQKAADERIPQLLATPAAVRFLSVEPLLGKVDIYEHLKIWWNSTTHTLVCDGVSGINWVICGGESGADARPMKPDWARGLRDQCVAAGVAFLFKQWGEWQPASNGQSGRSGAWDGDRFLDGWGNIADESANMVRAGKKAFGGRLLDGREWNEFPAEATQR